MSQTLVTPTFTASVRRALLRAWDDPESRSTMVGIAGVIVFYLLLWVVAPYVFRIEAVAVASRPHAASKMFNIELAPDMFVNKPAPKQDPFKFVETNPDAPENTPDKTNNFAAKNQQVAQEKPTPDGKSDRPALEGKKDFDSTQIVSGRLSQPIEQMEAVPPPAEAKVAAAWAEDRVTPLKSPPDCALAAAAVSPIADRSRWSPILHAPQSASRRFFTPR